MATLKHVQASLNEGNQDTGIQDSIAQMAVKEGAEAMPQEKFVIFKLVNTSKRGGVYIDGIDDVWNEATGKVERIRLLTGVDSIWLKDQKHITEDYARQNRRSLHFPRGAKVLRISENDATLLEFARRCNSNTKPIGKKLKGSHFEFFEYDPQAAAKEAYSKEVKELEMSIKASKLSTAEIQKIVLFVPGIGLYDEVGELKTEERLKTDVMLYAKKNPDAFDQLTGARAKEVEMFNTIRKALISNKIDVNTYPGKAFWAQGGGVIGVIPNGKDATKYLTELAMTNTEDGRKFAEELKKLM